VRVGSPGPPLWIWLFVVGIFVGVPAVGIGTALLLRVLRSRSVFRADSASAQVADDRAPGTGEDAGSTAGGNAGSGPDPAGGAASAGRHAEEPAVVAAREHARRTARWGMAGLAAGIVAGLVLVSSNDGGLAALACGGGYLCGLLIGEYVAQPRARGEQRAAVLRARRPGNYVPRWAAVMIAAVGTLIVCALISFAVASPIRYGAWHPVAGQSFTLPGGSTSWPALPVMLAGVGFAAAVLFVGAAGLRRVAGRPQLTDAAGQVTDEWLRRQSGSAITGAVLSLLLLVLAAFLIGGSQGLAVPMPVMSPTAYIVSRIMIFAGLCSACGSIVSWLLLSGRIRRPRPAAGPPAAPARSQA
jgi:xanthosine utilization system XapX-like protein